MVGRFSTSNESTLSTQLPPKPGVIYAIYSRKKVISVTYSIIFWGSLMVHDAWSCIDAGVKGIGIRCVMLHNLSKKISESAVRPNEIQALGTLAGNGWLTARLRQNHHVYTKLSYVQFREESIAVDQLRRDNTLNKRQIRQARMYSTVHTVYRRSRSLGNFRLHAFDR